ncbi:MerR family DNA-binding transcriptional regulator [Streptomyces sp. enrichment culture]|uniref:MerR family DNA-binding transcriptional regulator n=1 Tax=Streptomyces sp. enrichment culture TaxID=1795815 RepID=UPI003F571C1F
MSLRPQSPAAVSADVRALRYYEEQGLVIAEGSLSGHRQYPAPPPRVGRSP